MGSIISNPKTTTRYLYRNKIPTMSQSTQGFFSHSNNSSENNINGFQANSSNSNSNWQSGFNNGTSSTNKTSVITVNWEKEVDNVFMDEIGKFSKQCNGGFSF